jgi:uncharacterized phage protein gp47/JayE
MATLDDLLVPRDRDTIEALLLSTLQAEGFPVTDWYVGSVPRTLLKMIATGLLDRETLIGYITAGGFLDLAATLTDSSGASLDAWLEMLAAQQYDKARAPATFTQKQITVTCATGFGPISRAAGEFVAISQAGNYYTNVDSVSVADGGSAPATFQAQSPGPVIDATGTIDTLATPLPGVSILDRPTTFSIPVKFWNGTGTITPSASGTPSPARTIKVTIVSPGRIDGVSTPVATFKADIYSNGTVTSDGPRSVTATYAQDDVTLTFADGTAGTNSFIGGDVWYVSTPGQPTLQSGADEESLTDLAQRCRDMWPALSAIPTEGKYAAWARQCSVEQSLGVTRIMTSPSLTVAGVVEVYVADSTGAAQPATVTAIQTYIDKRSVDIERASVAGASSVTISVTGIVYARRTVLASIKAKAKTAWNAYLASVPIGGEMPWRLVRVSKLDQILEDLGAYNSTNLAINGGGIDKDLSIAANEVPAASANGTDDLTWYEVP